MREVHDRLPRRISGRLVHASQTIARGTRLLTELFWSECQSAFVDMARKRVEFIPTTHADGFNGIAGITWVGACQRTRGKLDAGRPSVATRCRSDAIVSQAIRPAAHGNDKRCCTGHMIAGKSKAARKLRRHTHLLLGQKLTWCSVRQYVRFRPQADVTQPGVRRARQCRKAMGSGKHGAAKDGQRIPFTKKASTEADALTLRF